MMDNGTTEKTFLEGRLEFVAEINKVTFINDSKCTTPASGRWAIEQQSRPVMLIAGGKDRGDFHEMVETVRKKVRKIILIGRSREGFKAIFEGVTQVEEAESMDEAVKKAIASAQPGDCVLLAPMCPSFDQFKSYKERGEYFKKAISALKKP